jgi:FAD/FMN-containing dehydrogenase
MNDHITDFYREIRGQFKGTLLRPNDADYGKVAPVYKRRPGIIARCKDVADIQTFLRLATKSDVLTAVRCGGHSLAGASTCDDGLVIDLSAFREVRVDPVARRAYFGDEDR